MKAQDIRETEEYRALKSKPTSGKGYIDYPPHPNREGFACDAYARQRSQHLGQILVVQGRKEIEKEMRKPVKKKYKLTAVPYLLMAASLLPISLDITPPMFTIGLIWLAINLKNYIARIIFHR